MRTKPSSPNVKRSPSSVAGARTALVINQFATPGLGSLMAGRYLAGGFQLVFALVGFTLILIWVILLLKAAYDIMETTGEPKPPHFLGWLGLASFAFAWVWAWFTSISVLREAQEAHQQRFEHPQPAPGAEPGPPPTSPGPSS